MAGELDHPHDRLFRAVFADAAEAAGLLQGVLSGELREKVRWDSLRLLDGTFLDEALRESESDLLFEAGYGDEEDQLRLYLLFEHQSTPDPWMRFRLLKYCCRIWEAERRDEPGRSELRPIVPLVFYQGRRGWRHSTEFADLFPPAVRGWRWVPRFAHVLVDQTGLEPERVEGGTRGRIAQLLMMAACGRHADAALETAARLAASAIFGGAVNHFRLFVLYVMATQDEAAVKVFDEALRRHGREQGGDVMSYAQQLLEEGRKEGREEGVQRGKLEAVEGLLRAEVTWSVIKTATGLDEAGYRALKARLAAAPGQHGNPT